jgi:flagellar biosynthesis/type III secretory pathway chaperone
MNPLYDLLKGSTQLYSKLLELEHEKYDAVIKADVEVLDDIVSKEQAYYMKMRGDEQKREKLLKEMGFSGKTMREIINMSQGEEKDRLNDVYNELNGLLKEVKKINGMCKTLIEVRLRRVDNALSQLGEKENTYTETEHKNGNAKSLIFSKKI